MVIAIYREKPAKLGWLWCPAGCLLLRLFSLNIDFNVDACWIKTQEAKYGYEAGVLDRLDRN